MTPETRLIIDRLMYDGESKKYPSTQEQIDRNRREIEAQRQREEQARNEANRDSNGNAGAAN